MLKVCIPYRNTNLEKDCVLSALSLANCKKQNKNKKSPSILHVFSAWGYVIRGKEEFKEYSNRL